jgi:alpha-galactosidase
MKELRRQRINVYKIEKDHALNANNVWNVGNAILISKYWSGEVAPPERHAAVRMHWTENALYVRFDAAQKEPLIIGDDPQTATKTLGLWDRDVCEMFIAPDASQPGKYFEFEVAPTGEWIDLSIEFDGKERNTDTDYNSGFESYAAIENDKIVVAMKISWKAFGRKPAAGNIWLGNLFRCVGKDPTRGYMAWQPTFTETPNFHVPESFAGFVFE